MAPTNKTQWLMTADQVLEAVGHIPRAGETKELRAIEGSTDINAIAKLRVAGNPETKANQIYTVTLADLRTWLETAPRSQTLPATITATIRGASDGSQDSRDELVISDDTVEGQF